VHLPGGGQPLDGQLKRARLLGEGQPDEMPVTAVDAGRTKTGGALRRDVEDLTDRLAAGPVERLGSTGVERAITLAAPVSRHLIDTGLIPLPNPVGVPRP
jgi:hypothetical protein